MTKRVTKAPKNCCHVPASFALAMLGPQMALISSFFGQGAVSEVRVRGKGSSYQQADLGFGLCEFF